MSSCMISLLKRKHRLLPVDQRYFPEIYSNRIVWSDNRNGNWDIYMYDLSTKKETQITTNSSDSETPVIYGNSIHVRRITGTETGIYMYLTL